MDVLLSRKGSGAEGAHAHSVKGSFTLPTTLLSFSMKGSKMKVAQSCPTLCDPTDHTVHGMLQARILEWQPFPSPGDLPNPGIEARSPTLQADSLPSEPPGKPRNTGVGSLSLLQQICPTQGSSWGLLHCRRVLYQLHSRLVYGTGI